MTSITRDITIVGAGPAGLSFALLVARSGLRITLIDRQSREQLAQPDFDGRDIALTHQSVRILESLGVWAGIDTVDRPPIRSARVEDGRSPYALEFDPSAGESETLGYIVSNHHIRRALFKQIQGCSNIELLASSSVNNVRTGDEGAVVELAGGQTVHAGLIVSADSRFSECRRQMGISASMHDFGRVCIVCRAECAEPHDGIAFECFHYGRTLAVLPLGENTCSVVITAPMHQRDAIMDMDEEQFSRDLEQRFHRRLGRMRLVSKRFAYPLVGVHARKFHAKRFALIGDAAVGMHPVTAHGFNLGLGGAEILAGEVTRAWDRGADIGDTRLLKRYEARHMRRTKPVYFGTNGIVHLFTDDRLPAKFARQVVLRVANNLPPLKRSIRHMLTDPQPGTRQPVTRGLLAWSRRIRQSRPFPSSG